MRLQRWALLLAGGAIGTSGFTSLLRNFNRWRRDPQVKWERLTRQLTVVDKSCLEEIVRDAVDESGERRTDDEAHSLESGEILRLIGGLEGLETLLRNSAVLVAMGYFVHELEQWYPGTLNLTSDLEISARQLGWYVGRLRIAIPQDRDHSLIANCAQLSAVIYRQMSRRLTDFYTQNDLPPLVDLLRVI